MVKSELLKLIESLGENDDVLETLKGVEGLSQSSFDATKLTIDDYKSILESNAEIKGYTTSSIDSAISKAINSHDEKFMKEKFPQLLESEIKKRSNEGKTPEQIELEEVKAKIQQMETEKAKAEMKAKYTKVLSDKGLSTDLLDLLNLSTDNEEVNNTAIDKISEIFNNAITNGINSKITENPPIPTKSEGLNNLTGVEAAFYAKNPDLLK